MKIRKITALLLAFAVMCSACASNSGESVTEVTENIAVEEKILTAEMADAIEAVDGVITIPDGITAIGFHAFGFRTDFHKVIIPDGVTEVENEAFYYCEAITEITLPDSVVKIGDDAFNNCTALENITFSENLSQIGDRVFNNCYSMKEIDIPESVTEIGEHAFRACGGLESIVIPHSITEIKANTFYDCDGLKNITIPDSVTAIGDKAFASCNALEELYLPDSITSLSETALKGNSAVVYFKGKKYGYGSDFREELYAAVKGIATEKSTAYAEALEYEVVDGTVIIPDGTTEIKPYAFSQRSDITGVSIPASVVKIGKNAFEHCENLKEVVIPDTVTTLSEGVFYNCGGLKKVVLPDGITAVPADFCHLDSALETAVIPETVTEIGDYAFFSCDKLSNVEIGKNVTKIGGGAFAYCESLTMDLDLINVSDLGGSAFSGTNITSVIFPDGITIIPDCLMHDCNNLTEITVPDGVTEIGELAFTNCKNLTKIYIPDSIEIVGMDALTGSDKLSIIYKGKTYCYKDDVLFYSTFREMDYIAPPDGMTTDDLCGILYYNGKQLQLPLTAEDFLALNENWVIDQAEGEEPAAFIRDVDENGNWEKSMLIYACNNGSIHSREDVNRLFIMSGFELGGFSLNGDIEIGDDRSEIIEAFGYPSYEEEGYDAYWFRDEKRVFKLDVTYTDGKIEDVLILILGLIQD